MVLKFQGRLEYQAAQLDQDFPQGQLVLLALSLQVRLMFQMAL